MPRTLVLLRAVNLGGRNKVPMAALRAALAEAGLDEVGTYIASGNVLCTASGSAANTARLVEKVITDEFGVDTTAVVRTLAQLRKARAAYPLATGNPKWSAIMFLAKRPTAAKARALGEIDFGEDECRVIGTELHLRYDKGIHASKMTGAKLEKALGVEGTARNLATVDKLIELLSD